MGIRGWTLPAALVLGLTVLTPLPAQAANPPYGALAWSKYKHVTAAGFATTKDGAIKAAHDNCARKSGVLDCVTLNWFHNAVGALAEGTNHAVGTGQGWGWKPDGSADKQRATHEAANAAVRVCTAFGGTNCKVVYSVDAGDVAHGEGGSLVPLPKSRPAPSSPKQQPKQPKTIPPSPGPTAPPPGKTPAQPGLTYQEKRALIDDANEEWVSLNFFMTMIGESLTEPLGLLAEFLGIVAPDSSDKKKELALRDPPDPNFTIIAHPVVPAVRQLTVGRGITAKEAAAVNALNHNFARKGALLRVLTKSIERAQGARAGRNTVWEGRQLNIAKQYAGQLAAAFRAEPSLFAEVRSAISAAGPRTFRLTAPDVRNMQRTVAARGLPTPVVKSLRQVGATTADINRIQQDVRRSDPNATAALGGGRFPEMLTDKSVKDSTLRAARALEEFARRGR